MNLTTIFNKITGKTKQPTQPDPVYSKVQLQYRQRFDQDIQNWKHALQAAESIYNPNRLQLYNVYRNIADDAHLSSVVSTRMIKAVGKTFRVVNANGTEDKAKTEFFKAAWFEDFLKFAWEARTYGYSLMQINGITNGVIDGIKLIPRENVRPADKLVVATPGLREGWNYTTGEGHEWAVGVGGDADLGLFQKVAPLVLFKQFALSSWAQFLQIYGIPFRVGKTEQSSPERVQAMFDMLGDMSSAAYGVMDKDDVVEFMEASKADGSAFNLHLDFLDKQISKVILGGTMISDDGSSRSQSEVHERTTADYTEYDTKFLRYAVNDNLLPALTKLGINFDGFTFEFYDDENMEALFDMTVQLLNAGQQVDAKWMADKFKIPVLGAATLPATTNFLQPV
jgi:phage gp29-like protein